MSATHSTRYSELHIFKTNIDVFNGIEYAIDMRSKFHEKFKTSFYAEFYLSLDSRYSL